MDCMYCGGGFRSALACGAAQNMDYTNVRSLIGGKKPWPRWDGRWKSGGRDS